jgi:hypothetical protein
VDIELPAHATPPQTEQPRNPVAVPPDHVPAMRSKSMDVAPLPSTSMRMQNLWKSKSADVAPPPSTVAGMQKLRKTKAVLAMARPPPVLTRPTPSPAPPARPIPPARLEMARHGVMEDAV